MESTQTVRVYHNSILMLDRPVTACWMQCRRGGANLRKSTAAALAVRRYSCRQAFVADRDSLSRQPIDTFGCEAPVHGRVLNKIEHVEQVFRLSSYTSVTVVPFRTEAS